MSRRSSGSRAPAKRNAPAPSTPVKRYFLRRFFQGPDAALASVVIVSGAIIAWLGLAKVPIAWVIAGTATLTAAAFTWGRSLAPDTAQPTKVGLLHATAGIMTAFIVGAGSYVTWLAPSSETYRTYGFVLRTDINSLDSEAQCNGPSGHPEGPPLTLDRTNKTLAPICGGQSYPFECTRVLDSGKRWFKFSHTSYWSGYWMAGDNIWPAPGVSVSDVPECDD